jgi:hypothetical protein
VAMRVVQKYLVLCALVIFWVFCGHAIKFISNRDDVAKRGGAILGEDVLVFNDSVDNGDIIHSLRSLALTLNPQVFCVRWFAGGDDKFSFLDELRIFEIRLRWPWEFIVLDETFDPPFRYPPNSLSFIDASEANEKADPVSPRGSNSLISRHVFRLHHNPSAFRVHNCNGIIARSISGLFRGVRLALNLAEASESNIYSESTNSNQPPVRPDWWPEPLIPVGRIVCGLFFLWLGRRLVNVNYDGTRCGRIVVLCDAAS